MSLESNNHGNYHCLFGLSANTHQYEYQNSKHFLSLINDELSSFISNPRSQSEYIIFTGVDNETFLRDFTDPENDLLEFETYSATHHVILYKMESNTHAVAHMCFHDMLRDKLRLMDNAYEQLRPHGAAHVQGEDRKKRADQSYKPKRLPSYRSNHWPSLVVEVGYSETQRKLKADVNWWTTSSQGDVKAVITIAIDKHFKKITICQWDNTGLNRYENILSQGNNRKAVQQSNPRPLVIDFESVLLRLPLGIEKNISLSVAELEDFAKEIWDVEFNQSPN